ncbi:hypothetical protein Bca52824_023407 [Brassica carinata]|uniref:Uncharacterized protein n=1 Tax=Brassica carinata TaxID=52824 RepID=A0A8X7VJ01_BRACI|nr:hypothetical protein Bca52824_023407 [Brassica carinata]
MSVKLGAPARLTAPRSSVGEWRGEVLGNTVKRKQTKAGGSSKAEPPIKKHKKVSSIVEDEVCCGGKGASEKEGTEDIENKKFTAKAITIVARASDVDFVTVSPSKDPAVGRTQLKFKRRKTAENKARLAEERKEAADLKKKLKVEIKQEVPKEERWRCNNKNRILSQNRFNPAVMWRMLPTVIATQDGKCFRVRCGGRG